MFSSQVFAVVCLILLSFSGEGCLLLLYDKLSLYFLSSSEGLLSGLINILSSSSLISLSPLSAEKPLIVSSLGEKGN